MKRSQLLSVLKLAAICILILVVPYVATNAAVQHGFQIKEYALFHDILHPLQHEALPQGDFRRIRSMANELVTRGKAIVKLGVPEAPKANRREFAKALREFDRALAEFKTDAKAKNNTKLKKSYIAVHDLFEKLADLVPTVYPRGMPPIIGLDCPPGKLEAGSRLTLTANTAANERLVFLWEIRVGKVLAGQGTPTITIDTTGLAGHAIPVSVEVNDGNGLTAVANCLVEISAGNQPQAVSLTKTALLSNQLKKFKSLSISIIK
jgi:hypothetical protein